MQLKERQCQAEGCPIRFTPKRFGQRFCCEDHRKRTTDHSARTTRRRIQRQAPTVFVGVDGEAEWTGCNIMDCPCARFAAGRKDKYCTCGHRKYNHRHAYTLLGCGDEHVANLEGLDFAEIFTFLYRQFKKRPRVAYVGFFLGFDFTHWQRSMPEDKAWFLLSDKGIRLRKRQSKDAYGSFPVRLNEDYIGVVDDGIHQAWEVEYLANRSMSIRPMLCDCDLQPGIKCVHDRPSWMTICDTGAFFQTSFLQVINPKDWPDGPVCTPEEYAIIEAGKSRRDDAVLDKEMIEYNRLECEILARVMSRYDEGLRSLGIQLKRDLWYGPGACAKAWLKLKKIPNREAHKDIVPLMVQKAAESAYLGGWFEIFMHGFISGEIHECDINSAYPTIICKLPCLLHGSWKRDTEKKLRRLKPGQIRLLRTTPGGVIGSDPYIGAMLHRQHDETIMRPHRTGGWYWQHEIEAAMRAGVVDQVTTVEAWTYTPCDCPPPLAEIADLYALRLKVGKKTPLGKAIKLIINSVYGVFAQGVGTRPYANYVYAGLITAGTRTQILDAIATHPERTRAVAMIATDGVYFTSPHPTLSLSDKLGDWEPAKDGGPKMRRNMTIFKPGAYWDDDTREQIRAGDKPIFKARGINAKAFAKHLDDLDARFVDMVDGGSFRSWPTVDYSTDFSMVTAKTAIHRRKWGTAGMVNDDVIHQSSDPESKRCDPYLDEGLHVIRTRPHRQGDRLTSREYASPATREALALTAGMRTDDDDRFGNVSPDGPIAAILYGWIGTGQWA